MKFFLIIIVALMAAGGGYLAANNTGHVHGGAPKSETAPGKQLYTCGMHPQIIQDKPGDCPICGMKLTPVRNQGVSAAADASAITIDPVTVQNMNLRTGLVTNGPVNHHVRTVGAVEFDETSMVEVTTKVKGWIETLYVDATGQMVHKGDPLFEFYSPELYSAQTEYLLAVNSSESMKETALNKLKFYDISDEQIAELEKTKQVKKTLRILAPRNGVVVEKMAVQGQMIEAGMKLYRLADLSTVWVQTQVYEKDLPFVALGQEATVSLSYLSDRKFRGRVTYIYPTIDDKTRTAKVRMEFHNPGFFLKPGMFATVDLESEVEHSAVLVPDSAVLRSGQRNTVFIAHEGGHFEARIVTLGARTDGDYYQVLDGLKSGDRVVVSGQFMLDSESQLREAIQKMSGAGQEVKTAAVQPEKKAPTASSGTNDMVYICPMPEHVSITYAAPGKCPLCGMTLVPVSQQTLEKVQPGALVDYYTCPMPEHSDVHESKLGKCPKCGMTLIPVMKQTPASTNSITVAPDVKLYTCPMEEDADIVSNKPGRCSKCGMKLVETSTVAHGKIAEKHWKDEHVK